MKPACQHWARTDVGQCSSVLSSTTRLSAEAWCNSITPMGGVGEEGKNGLGWSEMG